MTLVHPGSRLRRGLELLQDCAAGRLPEIMRQLSSLPPGEARRVVVRGDVLFLVLQRYPTRRRAEGRFEAHARHTDLQFLWSGCECIEVCDARLSKPVPAHDENGNAYFPMGDLAASRLLLQAGEVAVLLPQDAHAPGLSPEDGGQRLVRKIVVKVKDAHLSDVPMNKSPAEAATAPAPRPAPID